MLFIYNKELLHITMEMKQMSELCSICPRECKAERKNGRQGFCRMSEKPTVARVSVHMWEEPCISGDRGSGTIFFSGCVMKCVFCQNYKISAENFGKEISAGQLADCYKKLEQQGVHNINLVNPTHFVPAIIESLDIYRPSLPIIYNCGGYEKKETLKKLEGYIDVYLPDFKYAFEELADKYSGTKKYPSVAVTAAGEMLRQQPENIFDKDGIIQKGVIIRHLILPSNTRNSIAVIDMLKENFGTDITVSLMAQYVPCGKASVFSEIDRKITRREYNKVLDYLENSGLNGYTQELSSATKDYIPDFNLQGIE